MGQSPEIEIVGVEAVRPLALRALDLGPAEFGSMMPTMSGGDLVLQVEDVLERAVESVGPEMRAGLGFDQLAGDARRVAGLAHAALEHIAHAEFAPDLLDVDRLALVDEARIARDHEQPVDARKPGDDVLDHAVGRNIPAPGRRSCSGTAERRSRACREGQGAAPAFPPRRLDRRRGFARARARLQRIDPHRLGNVLRVWFDRDR